MKISRETGRVLWGVDPTGEFMTPGVRWARASGLRLRVEPDNPKSYTSLGNVDHC